jgi:glycosyltransferase involved in cell wall biosynthesis
MSKIKILHIIKTLNLGGAETNLLNLLQAADKQRYEMHIGYSFGGELEKGFIQAQARLFKYSKRSHRIKSVASVAIIARIWWYLLVNRIDIVHTHNFSGHIWGVIAAKLAGKKIVEHVHDFRYSDSDDFAHRRGVNNQYQFIRFFKNISDRVIVLTKQNSDFLLQQKYYSPDKVVELQNGIPLIPYAVSAVERTRITARLGIRSDAQIILTPARIASEKNLDLIFRIAALIKKAHPRVMFVIAGDGPLFKEYQEYVKGRHAATYIEFIGFYADIRQLLAVSDIFLLPSFLELHSIAILEAMSMKVPVVISRDVGCNSEFIDDGKNGMLCDPFVDSGWADAMGRLLADQEYRQSVGQAGYQTCVEKFDINKTVKNIEGIYEHFAST